MHCLLENHKINFTWTKQEDTPEVKWEDVSYLKRNKQQEKIQRKISDKFYR